MSEHDEKSAMDELERLRSEATRAIVDSAARKKLVVAGPGTGKTYTFQEALRAAGGKGLALTFIRNLVDDLTDALGDLAGVFTLHGYCKFLLHRSAVEGLQKNWDYFPLLLELLADDLHFLGREGIKREDIEKALHDLDDNGGLITDSLRLGNYYNAVSHVDLVYRVLRYLEHNPDEIREYPLIVVDEYQDFSLLETSFIVLLATKSSALIAGDDDQALYSFKNASAKYIRDIARGGDYELFELPYCSRCTVVIVDAVNDLIQAGLANGNMIDRLDKRFECYLPDKLAHSNAHPKIILANCSVHSKRVPYVGKYIAKQIKKIPAEHVQTSKEQGHPTVLVIGDRPFMPTVYEVVKEAFPQTQMKRSPDSSIELLDGYRRLALDENSRLGWRIAIHTDPPRGTPRIIKEVLENEEEFPPHLPDEYREKHLQAARLVHRLLEGPLTPDEEKQLVAAVGVGLQSIKEKLAIRDDDTEVELPPDDEEAPDDSPTIVCTSRLGAKGLSAEHVFIIGVNDGYFPQRPEAITDEEICKLLVGLSRTRKQCHIVSCGRFGAGWLNESRFAEWLRPHLEPVKVDKDYFSVN